MCIRDRCGPQDCKWITPILAPPHSLCPTGCSCRCCIVFGLAGSTSWLYRASIRWSGSHVGYHLSQGRWHQTCITLHFWSWKGYWMRSLVAAVASVLLGPRCGVWQLLSLFDFQNSSLHAAAGCRACCCSNWWASLCLPSSPYDSFSFLLIPLHSCCFLLVIQQYEIAALLWCLLQWLQLLFYSLILKSGLWIVSFFQMSLLLKPSLGLHPFTFCKNSSQLSALKIYRHSFLLVTFESVHNVCLLYTSRCV